MKYLILLGLAAIFSQNVFADGFTVTTGADYSSGKYGSSDSTNVAYVPFSLSYNADKFTYKVTVPYLSVDGPGDIIPGGFGGSGAGGGSSSGAGTFGCAADNRKGAKKPEDNGPCAAATTTTSSGSSTTATTSRKHQSGLGDIVAGVTYNLLDSQAWGLIVDLNARVKFGTASESKGLGSGKNDYALQTYIEKTFGAPYVSLLIGTKFLGEPSGVSYNTIVYSGLGGGYRFDKKTTVGFSYDWSSTAFDGATQPQEISVYGSHRFNDQYKLNAVIYTGLSDASPDVGGGATLFYYF